MTSALAELIMRNKRVKSRKTPRRSKKRQKPSKKGKERSRKRQEPSKRQEPQNAKLKKQRHAPPKPNGKLIWLKTQDVRLKAKESSLKR
jgi:hypothetical protein